MIEMLKMLNALSIIDSRGDILILERYNRSFDEEAHEDFRISCIASSTIDKPFVQIKNTVFMFITDNDLFYVASTKKNINAAMVYTFLSRIPKLIQDIIGIKPSKMSIQNNAAKVVELLDEMIDGGCPQLTQQASLRQLTQRASTENSVRPLHQTEVTIMATGQTLWRPPHIVYKKNVMTLHIDEKVSSVFSPTGKVLDSSVEGIIKVKCQLSGMPECKIGFNDKAATDTGRPSAATRNGTSVQVDGMTFHKCVRLDDFANERAITFIPPDGKFELLRYRKTENVAQPFNITPMVRTISPSRISIRVVFRTNYNRQIHAKSIVVRIPLPDNVSKTGISCSTGKAKYDDSANVVVWNIGTLNGAQQEEVKVLVQCLASNTKQSPSLKLTKPVTVDFKIPRLTSSGLKLMYLKITERSNYSPEKKIKYKISNGAYEARFF